MTITLYPQDIKRIWILFWKYTGNCMTRMRPKYRFLDYHNQTGWQVTTGQLVYHVTKSANVNGSGSCGKLYLGHTRLHPEDMWHWPNDGLILVHSHRHWPDRFNVWIVQLTLSSLNLPLSSSSTTSRELLSQFSCCSGWRWFDVI